jgi:hypothetical protein
MSLTAKYASNSVQCVGGNYRVPTAIHMLYSDSSAKTNVSVNPSG